jgi:hypothetical protein
VGVDKAMLRVRQDASGRVGGQVEAGEPLTGRGQDVRRMLGLVVRLADQVGDLSQQAHVAGPPLVGQAAS